MPDARKRASERPKNRPGWKVARDRQTWKAAPDGLTTRHVNVSANQFLLRADHQGKWEVCRGGENPMPVRTGMTGSRIAAQRRAEEALAAILERVAKRLRKGTK